MKYFLIETVQVFKEQHIIQAETLEDAKDEVVCEKHFSEVGRVSSEFLEPFAISTARELTETEVDDLIDQGDNPWKHRELVHTITYE